jgi:hypothetical protein
MEQPYSAPPSLAKELRETGITHVMTSTSFGKHPLAWSHTGLPILEIGLNIAEMNGRLQPLLEPLTGAGHSATVSYAKLLAYQQGNRGVIRYEVSGLAAGDSPVLGKLYPDLLRAERTYTIMHALWLESNDGGASLGVPQPLGCIPDLAMLVYLPVEGRFLNEVIAENQASRYLRRAGEWLAALHRSRLVLDRQFQHAAEAVNLQAWEALIAYKYPDSAAAAHAIAQRLQQWAGALSFATAVPIHKDFHYGHILVDAAGDDVKVIDFDEMRMGDPSFDLAHFCANLQLLVFRRICSLSQLATLQSTFLDAYARRTGWVRDERFVYFYAYSCLKIAKQLCTLRGLRPRPDGEEQRQQVQLILDRGLAALDRKAAGIMPMLAVAARPH